MKRILTEFFAKVVIPTIVIIPCFLVFNESDNMIFNLIGLVYIILIYNLRKVKLSKNI